MHRSIKDITTIPIEQGWFKGDDSPPNTPPLMRMSVMVRKVAENGSLGETFIGHIVTHLSPEDWCSLHGYWLQQSYPITSRRALKGETTELF